MVPKPSRKLLSHSPSKTAFEHLNTYGVLFSLLVFNLNISIKMFFINDPHSFLFLSNFFTSWTTYLPLLIVSLASYTVKYLQFSINFPFFTFMLRYNFLAKCLLISDCSFTIIYKSSLPNIKAVDILLLLLTLPIGEFWKLRNYYCVVVLVVVLLVVVLLLL